MPRETIGPREQLIQAVMVTAELMGRQYTPVAAAVLVDDLGGYDVEQVLRALARTRREVRGFLTVADVIARLDDGRPGPDEAWAMLPFDEAVTVVWTPEMAQAWGVAMPLLEARDKAGAQRAFRETYVRLVADARERRESPRWMASLGHDVQGREGALMAAASMGRLTTTQAKALLPAKPATALLEMVAP